MKRSMRFVLVAAAAISVSCNSSELRDFPELRGDYFGQRPPGRTPEEFAPTVYAAYMPAFGSVFSPDLSEFYFVADIGGEEGGDILVSRKADGVWTQPEAASFNSRYTDNDMCYSPDGERMFWRSWRPLGEGDTEEESSYIWTVTRVDIGWSEPQLVFVGDIPLQAGYPSMTTSGTLYFPYRHGPVVGEQDIFLSTHYNEGFSTPVNIGRTVNTEYIEGDMVVAPDESFLVVAGWDRPDNVGGGSADLYVSFKGEDGTWSEQINLGPAINTEVMENVPTLSPDGRYFFFFRYDFERDVGGTYWVDASVIQDLRPREH